MSTNGYSQACSANTNSGLLGVIKSSSGMTTNGSGIQCYNGNISATDHIVATAAIHGDLA
jgi:hypothetical protein